MAKAKTDGQTSEDQVKSADAQVEGNSVNMDGVAPGTSTTMPDGTVITHY